MEQALKRLLPGEMAAELHQHACHLVQQRAVAAEEPVDSALRARVVELEAKAAELVDAVRKQRGVGPEWVAHRLDEEQRRALGSLLTEDVLQLPHEAELPPTPDSQLFLHARRDAQQSRKPLLL